MQYQLLAILFTFISSATTSNSFSTPNKTPTAFQDFVFSSNGVCTDPEIFYLRNDASAESNHNDDDDIIKQCIAKQRPISEVDIQKMAAKGKKIFTMRNVPGEGDCMFQAVALATAASMGLGGNNALLRAISEETRDVVAQVMASPDGNLHIEGQRLVRTSDLLLSASRQEGTTPEEYIGRLRKSGTEGGLYGGGPELTVLSNLLRRPISIYELDDDSNEEYEQGDAESAETLLTQPSNVRRPIPPKLCRIKLAGVFGDRFKDPCLSIPNSAILTDLQPGAYSWHLHILIVDSNANEKHACALLPQFSPRK